MWTFCRLSLFLVAVLWTTSPHVQAFQTSDPWSRFRHGNSLAFPPRSSPKVKLHEASNNIDASNPNSFTESVNSYTDTNPTRVSSADARLFETREAFAVAATDSRKGARWGRLDIDHASPSLAMSVAAGNTLLPRNPGNQARKTQKTKAITATDSRKGARWGRLDIDHASPSLAMSVAAGATPKTTSAVVGVPSRVRGAGASSASSAYENLAREWSQMNKGRDSEVPPSVSPTSASSKEAVFAGNDSRNRARWGRLDIDHASPSLTMSVAAGGTSIQKTDVNRAPKTQKSKTVKASDSGRGTRWGRLDIDHASPSLTMSVAAGNTLLKKNPADQVLKTQKNKTVKATDPRKGARWGRLDIDHASPSLAMSEAAGNLLLNKNPADQALKTQKTNSITATDSRKLARWGRLDIDHASPSLAMSVAAGCTTMINLPSNARAAIRSTTNDKSQQLLPSIPGRNASSSYGNLAEEWSQMNKSRDSEVAAPSLPPPRSQSVAGDTVSQGKVTSPAPSASSSYGNLAEEWSQMNKSRDSEAMAS
jgi:hypothetical protein